MKAGPRATSAACRGGGPGFLAPSGAGMPPVGSTADASAGKLELAADGMASRCVMMSCTSSGAKVTMNRGRPNLGASASSWEMQAVFSEGLTVVPVACLPARLHPICVRGCVCVWVWMALTGGSGGRGYVLGVAWPPCSCTQTDLLYCTVRCVGGSPCRR